MRTHFIPLSQLQVKILEGLSRRPDGEGSFLQAALAKGDDELVLDEAKIDRVQDLLTEALGRSGFGRDYVLTDQGRAIEDLIDKLGVSKPRPT